MIHASDFQQAFGFALALLSFAAAVRRARWYSRCVRRRRCDAPAWALLRVVRSVARVSAYCPVVLLSCSCHAHAPLWRRALELDTNGGWPTGTAQHSTSTTTSTTNTNHHAHPPPPVAWWPLHGGRCFLSWMCHTFPRGPGRKGENESRRSF